MSALDGVANTIEQTQKGLGFARDGVQIGSAGTNIGFGIARTAVGASFGVARFFVRAPAAVAACVAGPVNPVRNRVAHKIFSSTRVNH